VSRTTLTIKQPTGLHNGDEAAANCCLQYLLRKRITNPKGQSSFSGASRPHAVNKSPIFHATARFTSVYNFNIIFPSTPTSSTWSPSFSSSNQKPPFPHTCYMPRLFHRLPFDHPINIWWKVVPIMNLFITPRFSSGLLLLPLRPKYLPQHPVSEHPRLAFLPYVKRPSFTPIQNDRRSYCCIWILKFFWIMNVERNGRDLLWGVITSITWRHWGPAQQSSQQLRDSSVEWLRHEPLSTTSKRAPGPKPSPTS